jgi:hypothetical protein
VGALSVVAELLRNLFPEGAVPGAIPRERMSYLMQEYLVNFVILVFGGEMLRDGDALLAKVTQPCAGAGMVEIERPLLGIQVQANECISPHPHAVEISH